MPDSVLDKIPTFTKNDNIYILFCDIAEFTTLCSTLKAHEIGELIHTVFSKIDEFIKIYNLEKIRTIGDGYLITHGVFDTYTDSKVIQHKLHSQNPYFFAKNIIRELQKINIQLRVGIHAGCVVSGIVGQTHNQFDLFGHDVNVAARLEQTCKPGCIHISDRYFQMIKHIIGRDYTFQKTAMKNMDDLHTVMIPIENVALFSTA
jgi:class 3 adenylate cyclase